MKEQILDWFKSFTTLAKTVERQAESMRQIKRENAELRYMLGVQAEKTDSFEPVARLFDKGGAFVGRGVAVPFDGVGAKGFNVVEPGSDNDGSATYFCGMTGSYIWRNADTGEDQLVHVVNGIVVDVDQKFRR